MIEEVYKQVSKLLYKDNSGHGIDHIERVLYLSLKFAEKENADKEIVSLIALLHDVDDYKLFGLENSKELNNAKRIMNECEINEEIKEQILNELKCIGYSKSLEGYRPQTLEGKIVSDADMCDAIGAIDIIRIHKYTLKHNNEFFDKNIYPRENITATEYVNNNSNTSINHIFEKILKLKDLMLTDSGKQEAIKRHKFVISFLYEFFYEENAFEWIKYLDNYLKELEKNKTRTLSL